MNLSLVVANYTATSALGAGIGPLLQSLDQRRSGLSQQTLAGAALETWVGRVAGLEDAALPSQWSHLESRNNRLAWLALQQDDFLEQVSALREQLGPSRLGVITGTSTSSIGRTEEAYRQLQADGQFAPEYRQDRVHNMHSTGFFVAQACQITGPALTISTACSSSAKVFASAARWICQGLVDAVVVGGVDSLCLSTLYGFNSLQLISSERCRPFDANRNGINIGEAAGFAILTRKEVATAAQHELLGYGESSDAYHMAHPHPEAAGAILAMKLALQLAALDGEQVDYINLHGTASQANDEIETMALAATLGRNTLASSTKGWTGHTLGAAGILETVIVLETLRTGLVPGTLNLELPDPALHFPIMTGNAHKPVKIAMTNSFGFGGNNASLVFGRRRD